MKKRHPLQGRHPVALLLLFLAIVLVWQPDSNAAKFKSAEVTRVVNDVKLLIGTKTSRPASKGSVVSGSTAVRTGQKSRAELQFPDESIVRLGSNSVFSFLQGKREVDLEKGTLLMQVPKSLGRTKVKTAAISAAITGTTILIEYIPPVLDEHGNIIKHGTIKIIVIEGSLVFGLNGAPRKTMKLLAGEMVAFRTDAQQLPQKFQIDIGRLVKSSLLVDGGMGPLPFLEPIETERLAQNAEKRGGQWLGINTRRQPRGRIFSRILTGGIINKARTVINGRPTVPQPLPRPPAGGGGNNNNNTGGGRPTTPASGGVTLPDRPNRNPPGGSP